ncbi:tetraacyldisaccharide 4'-kinase [Lewinella cohaerens]|uniref:tetraacyldisaccharide 4'-kinase n=1 Tax=Lewinella cohaerens TaxID=70995 RepID=UPI00035FFCC5|nr:tetraacyldisaccharide 4'-kinase [Lewinella cohaerens]
MIQRKLVQLLLAPFSLLYGMGVSLRNAFYRAGLLKSMTFSVPVISVGNLSVGGAGKTPHIEYLIRLLREHIQIATLSRGYSRKTRGFLEVERNNNAERVGDEPLQFKRKYPDIGVYVAEDRAFAIPQIVMKKSDTQMVLLDDAFQHRSVKPGVNILLTEYSNRFTQDFLLPAGRLREWRESYERADVIIISKCPQTISQEEKEAIRAEINPLPHQQLFFSYYAYQAPYYQFNPRYRLQLDEKLDVLLICAIAKTDYLIDYLQSQVGSVQSLEFADHHYFNKEDISNLHRSFKKMDTNRKVIITTEKDAMRLELHREFLIKERLPIFVLPTEVQFHFGEGPQFDEIIRQYLLNFKV